MCSSNCCSLHLFCDKQTLHMENVRAKCVIPQIFDGSTNEKLFIDWLINVILIQEVRRQRKFGVKHYYDYKLNFSHFIQFIYLDCTFFVDAKYKQSSGIWNTVSQQPINFALWKWGEAGIPYGDSSAFEAYWKETTAKDYVKCFKVYSKITSSVPKISMTLARCDSALVLCFKSRLLCYIKLTNLILFIFLPQNTFSVTN